MTNPVNCTRNGGVHKPPPRSERILVDKFLARSLLYNAQMMEAVGRHGLVSMDVNAASVDELAQRCLAILGLEPGAAFR